VKSRLQSVQRAISLNPWKHPFLLHPHLLLLFSFTPPVRLLFPGLNLREREPHPAQKSARPSQEHFTTKEYARRLTWQRQSGTWIGQRFTLQRFRICRWNPPSSQGATVSVSRESILTSGWCRVISFRLVYKHSPSTLLTGFGAVFPADRLSAGASTTP